jgi:hypothetical protein
MVYIGNSAGPTTYENDVFENSATTALTSNSHHITFTHVTAADNGATKTAIVPWTVTGEPDPTATPAPSSPAAGVSQPTQPSGGGAPSSTPERRVIHMARHYHGNTFRLTLTITTTNGHKSLLVRYSDEHHRYASRLTLVQLGVRPLAHAGRRTSHEAARLHLLKTSHTAVASLAVRLTAPEVSRGLALQLVYSGSKRDLIILPHL